jgi:hypothetical protein
MRDDNCAAMCFRETPPIRTGEVAIRRRMQNCVSAGHVFEKPESRTERSEYPLTAYRNGNARSALSACGGGRTRTRTLDPLIKRRQKLLAIAAICQQQHALVDVRNHARTPVKPLFCFTIVGRKPNRSLFNGSDHGSCGRRRSHIMMSRSVIPSYPCRISRRSSADPT